MNKNTFLFLGDGFEEIEALATVDIMRRAEMPVVTVSVNPTAVVTGAHGVVVTADTVISEVELSDAEWLICPGGMPGASNLAACEKLISALQAQNAKGGKIAAICAAPAVVLAPSGVIDGKQATCYPGFEGAMGKAIYTDEYVVVDGNVVTACGPGAATAFALTIVSQTKGQETADQVAAGMLL